MAAIPRNKGMKFASGKYITFVDNDDQLIENALEILFSTAEQFEADVVQTEKYISARTKKPVTYQAAPFVDRPTLETDDIGERITRFNRNQYLWSIWSKLYRREFLIENHIECPRILWTEDAYFSLACICWAKNYVRIPQVIYIYGNNPSSVSRSAEGLERHFHRYVPALAGALKYLHKLFDRHPFFREHPEYVTLISEHCINSRLGTERGTYLKHAPHALLPFLLREFKRETDEDAEVVMAHLFNKACVLYKQLHDSKQKVAELEARLQKLKSMSTELLTELQK